MNWLHYLLEANLYVSIFYTIYCLFLNRETHYTLNRTYLLLCCLISFILPVIQIGVLKPNEPGIVTVAFLQPNGLKNDIATPIHPGTAPIMLTDLVLYGYFIGVAILTIVLIVRLIQLARMTRAGKQLIDGKYRMIRIEESNTAFSFFNYLFIGTKTTGTGTIIRHELVHIRQKHSADIIFMELLKIVNWFNPVIYLLQISLKTVHEYIADEQTAAMETDTLSYSSFLIDNAYGVNGFSITHSFFNYNLLKKRIIMLNQKRSGNLARLKYLVLLPVCGALLCVSTLAFSKNYTWIDLAPVHNLAETNSVLPVSQAGDLKIKSDTAKITPKGFKYQETGYLVKGKTNYRVIVTEKNGEEKEYFRNAATAADIKLLRDKYGYKFPTTPIFAKLPPPPPAPPAPEPRTIEKMAPPPPPKPTKPVKIVDVPLASRPMQSFEMGAIQIVARQPTLSRPPFVPLI